MAIPQEPRFSLGIEEEYLLVDTVTMELVSDPRRRYWPSVSG